MTDETKLLPCPFCGEADHDTLLVEHMTGTVRHPAYRVVCDNCGASAGYSDRGDHVEMWNTRALAARQPADPVTNASCCQPVRVQTLEWRNSYGVLRAKTLFGDYIITRHILKLLSGSEQVHDDTEAAKAAAQADYEARILSALEAAPRVSETPKSEHDRADVLTATTAPVAKALEDEGEA